MAKYKGAVVFVEGVHYPVGKDGEVDLDRPLRIDADTADYRDADEDEPLHNDQNHAQDLDLEVGGE